MKHTEGPWTSALEQGALTRQGTAIGIFTDSARVAKVQSVDVAYGEQRANAHLIAAAPDMLEALKEAVKDYEARGVVSHAGIVHMRDAIAKAEGNQ